MSEELNAIEDELEVSSTDEEMVSDRIADLVEYLVVSIVDDADSVSLEVIDGEDSSTI